MWPHCSQFGFRGVGFRGFVGLGARIPEGPCTPIVYTLALK